jgi:hypothetical protein
MNFSTNHHSLSDFITAFEEGTLPREEWTHGAHLTMALWYLRHYPEGEAERRIREGIKHYNAAVGVVSTPTSGYHETLTCFYTLVVKRFVETADDDAALSIETLVETMLASEIADRAYPLRFYSKELLFSIEARAAWTEPDKCGLDSVRPSDG